MKPIVMRLKTHILCNNGVFAYRLNPNFQRFVTLCNNFKVKPLVIKQNNTESYTITRIQVELKNIKYHLTYLPLHCDNEVI